MVTRHTHCSVAFLYFLHTVFLLTFNNVQIQLSTVDSINEIIIMDVNIFRVISIKSVAYITCSVSQCWRVQNVNRNRTPAQTLWFEYETALTF